VEHYIVDKTMVPNIDYLLQHQLVFLSLHLHPNQK
jgi:hypothetical protein